MGRAAPLIVAAGLIAAVVPACGDEPQLLVVVDTDLVTPAQMEAQPGTFVPAATFDRVRVEMIFPSVGLRGSETFVPEEHFQDFSIGPQTAWPITFGVRQGILERPGHMRIMLYRSDNVDTTFTFTEPTLRLALERLSEVEVPRAGIETIRIVLHGACIGHPADLEAGTTCIDDPRQFQPATEGIERVDGVPPSISGTWDRARFEPCTETAPASADAVCIPGSLGLRGDTEFGDADFVEGFLATDPRHLVHVNAFYMDRTEVTVARFREVAPSLGAELPVERSEADAPSCTWTPVPSATDNLPINCLKGATARAYCRARGGDLPSDAQWEQAARGRGQRAPYVWGRAAPACCAARIAQHLGCAREPGPSPVGSYADPSKCDGRADVSVDGVLDLAGNVREIVRDAALDYDDDVCAVGTSGILEDPVCGEDEPLRATRGGSYRSSFDTVKTSLRTYTSIAPSVGFRCVYRGAP